MDYLIVYSKNGCKIAAPGKHVDLIIIPEKGYRLKEGSLKYNNGAADIVIRGASFIMPASDVTITAIFEKIPPKPKHHK